MLGARHHLAGNTELAAAYLGKSLSLSRAIVYPYALGSTLYWLDEVARTAGALTLRNGFTSERNAAPGQRLTKNAQRQRALMPLLTLMIEAVMPLPRSEATKAAVSANS